MASFYYCIALSFCIFVTAFAQLQNNNPTEVVVQATNKSSVPSIHYIIDAVNCLKEAYGIYPDDIQRAKLFSELFNEKHPETQWNVVVGYTAAHIKSKWYIETIVTPAGQYNMKGDKNKLKDNQWNSGVLFLIFSKV